MIPNPLLAILGALLIALAVTLIATWRSVRRNARGLADLRRMHRLAESGRNGRQPPRARRSGCAPYGAQPRPEDTIAGQRWRDN